MHLEIINLAYIACYVHGQLDDETYL